MSATDNPANDLTAQGRAFSTRLTLLTRPTGANKFKERTLYTVASAFALARYTEEQVRAQHSQTPESNRQYAPPGIQRLEGNTRLLRSAAMDVQNASRALVKLPFARGVTGRNSARILGVAQALLSASEYRWSLSALATFLNGYQDVTPLNVEELWTLPIALKLALLEEILAQAAGAFSNLPASDASLDASLFFLQEISLTDWPKLLEPLVPFEDTLRQDPSGSYTGMDFESRDLYRISIAKVAARSPLTETDVAARALQLARDASRQPNANERIAARVSHIGYYLVGLGLGELKKQCGFRPTPLDRIRTAMRAYADDFYIGGIETVALLAMAAIILPLVPLYNPLGHLAIAFLLLLLPASQGAVELMNHTIGAILKPQVLPKLDFSAGIPTDCKTLVAVPVLLLNDQQVHDLVDELEVRSLANQDPNIHFALLTDLPDSVEKPMEHDTHRLVLLAGQLIENLNRRYADAGCGGFLMLHRHRIFNPRQGVWMGWERKRGKLLDLNRLVTGGMDSFPYKAGDTSVLHGMRYVLTLDSDTKLPRDSVHRMVGAIAHPLNRAILDPYKRIVTQGYGILQPRVGVAVQSVARSRLAALYSGQTGFDIYTRAVSDAYQDLYGEGIFTGKGLYEIKIVNEVLGHRFPQNSLLSHDLIEGAYARVGLLTDVEVIDDYPSHYSAQNRRKHRWVRGDWQILRWLLNRVPDYSGHLVRNPTSNISRWKIFDNLRRSLVEPATFLLLVVGWLWLPGTARYWTIATLLIVLIPVVVQFLFSLARAVLAEQRGHVRRSIWDSLVLLVTTSLNFVFLEHQTLLMFDAIARSLVRSFVTGKLLLEWETAAEAESGGAKRTPVETTMRFVPLLSLLLAILVWQARPAALPWALPILFLWAMAKPITLWLNRSPGGLEIHLSAHDMRFLRKLAWRTWRYFTQHVDRSHHMLVPDNVQEENYRNAFRMSPTNAGLQLNARQAALVFGYLTLPEYADQTLENLRTLDDLSKWRGHLLNWYATDTLQPIAPYIASSVDSGNFLASICSLRMGTLELLESPMLPALREGLLDILEDVPSPSPSEVKIKSALQPPKSAGHQSWLVSILALDFPFDSQQPSEAEDRARSISNLVETYLPWLHPKFRALAPSPEDTIDRSLDFYTPETSLDACRELQVLWAQGRQGSTEEMDSLANELISALASSEQHLHRLIANLKSIAEICDRLFQATDFRAMLHPSRRLLAVGYDTERGCPVDSCYDLLASEARTALFLAIAKGEIQQNCWFRVGRKVTMVDGNPVLMSWSGSMFEYLMPTLWMQTSPGTLLAQSLPGAVRAQQEFVARKRMPWGISEAGQSQRDTAGNYQYHAFGVPTLALNPPPEGSLVIAPYATALALEADPTHAMANLHRMQKLGWLGEFGFYESADYSTTVSHEKGTRYTLVRSWMAHHQGMSLLAIANFLADKPFQRWFHSDPRVRATELLLHEKPVQVVVAEETPHAGNVVFQPTLFDNSTLP